MSSNFGQIIKIDASGFLLNFSEWCIFKIYNINLQPQRIIIFYFFFCNNININIRLSAKINSIILNEEIY